jgi:Kef-type K+ transport system membrane component KefB/nucleotide-binding universal stress UspA family protein
MYQFLPILKITFPLQEPVLIFALVLVIILLAPALFKKIRVPEIIGLILAGVLVGPHGLNLLSEELEFSIFGTTGLLYLMFLAGLEIDIKDFQKNKNKSITFGALTFAIPFGLSYLAAHLLLDFSVVASFLISSMIATHTLVSYPIISSLGISKNRVINVSIGGTIIADTIALLILAVLVESSAGEIGLIFWLKFILYFGVFVFIVNWVFPRLSKWFFRNYDGQSSLEYVFVLTIVFVSAVIAEFAHIEPIIGAFFAGLALNRLIPKGSPLMNRIMFIGHTLFIPFFLISVGMLVDLGVLLESAEIHWIIGVLLIVALLTKYLAAYITQKVFGFNLKERNLIFGLTTARAASAIAIIIVGFNLGMVHETTMNATIILVLITSLISSFVTERSGKQLAVQKEKKEIPAREEERILIPISNPSTIEKLISFAVIIKNDKSDQPIFPINIVEDDQEATEKISEYTEMLESAKEHAAATDHIAKIITRVDTNVADGISRAIKELAINKVVIGWHDKTPTKDFFFGSLLNNLLEKTGKAVYVSRINSAVNLINKIHVLMPPNTEYEKGFYEWISDICDICGHTDSQMVFWGYENTHEKIKQYMNKQNKEFDVVYRHAKCVEMLKIISKKLAREDLLVIVKARKHTLSYNKEIAQIPEKIDQHFTDTNIVVVYPEQEIIYRDAMDVQV